MVHETDHVRFEDAPEISGLSAYTELLTNPDLAALYAALHRTAPVTAPTLVETASVSKKTVYDYLHRLEAAGLVRRQPGEGADAYEAEPFELTLTLRDIEVSITPDIVAVIASADAFPVVDRVREHHGAVPLVLAYDLVAAHDAGEITIRQIAELTGLPRGTTYDLVEALYEILDLATGDAGATTITPDDVDRDGDLAEQLLED